MQRGNRYLLTLIGSTAMFAPPAVAANAGTSVYILPAVTQNGHPYFDHSDIFHLGMSYEEMAAVRSATAAPKSRAKKPETATEFDERLMLARARRIEARLVACAHLSEPVEVQLDHSEEVNSWTDGHSVTVTEGLLRFVSDDDELAAVLGHETGHIKARHPMKEEKGDLLAVLATVVAGAVGGQNAAAATYAGTTALTRKYSRDEEAEADRIGLGLAEDAGFDGSAMSRFFAALSQAEAKDPALFSQFLADHPADAVRIHRLSTYPDLNPNLPANQRKLKQGLEDRDSPYSAALLAAQTFSGTQPTGAAVLPQYGPFISATVPPGQDLPLIAPADVSLAPEKTYDPASTETLPAPALVVNAQSQINKSSEQFFDVMYHLQGLEYETPRYGTGAYGRGVQWSGLLRNAWQAATQLETTLDPTAAAILNIRRASALQTAADSYVISPGTLRPSEIDLLHELSQQQTRARQELQMADEEALSAADACAQDSRDLASGLEYMENSLAGTSDSRSIMSNQTSQIAWFGSAQAGLSRYEANEALETAATAELRLEIAALDWQGRELSKAQRQEFRKWANTYLTLPASQAPDSGPFGASLLKELILARPIAEPSSKTSAADARQPGAFVIHFTGMPDVPQGIVLPAPSDDPDVISIARERGASFDRLQTLFQPIFVHIEREMAASIDLAAHQNTH